MHTNGRIVGQKVHHASHPIDLDVTDSYLDFAKGKRVYLACASSSKTDLPDESVDAIVTDPPFFDNVNYSQLADFFHVWQRYILGEDGARGPPYHRATPRKSSIAKRTRSVAGSRPCGGSVTEFCAMTGC